MAQRASGQFVDSIFARLIALAIVVCIGALFYVYWADDLRSIYAEGKPPAIPILVEQQPLEAVNAALQTCLDERVGHVDQMKADGIINDAQYASFRGRAEELCRAQNPG